MRYDEQTVVLVPTSPIPRHPVADLIEECLDSIRHYFPSAPIRIMADGVRPQVGHRAHQYELYKHAMFEMCERKRFGNCELRVFPEFSQQAIMTRETLRFEERPLVLFVEHDAILRRDPAIEWEQIADVILSGNANMVRLYQWEKIWHEHQHLMHGEFDHSGVKFIRTTQYSQWPNMGSLAYYRMFLGKYFAQNQRSMIETVMYSPVLREGWDNHKVVIYAPENMLTFNHRDGRTDQASGKRDPGDW